MNFLKKLGIKKQNSGTSTGIGWWPVQAETKGAVSSPVDGKIIGTVFRTPPEAYEEVVTKAQDAFAAWRMIPAPGRGEIVRQIGLMTRKFKEPLATLISWEMGKSLQESLGEVQEMIDICDYAVGQSRMLSGFTLQSERSLHRMYEQYQPLGIIGIATAFNFPVAVWAWNAMIAAICGDVTIWKPSSTVPLSAIAVQKIIGRVLEVNNLPEGIFSLVTGRGSDLGERLLRDPRIPLISFTGSVPVGRHAAEVVARRLGRTILELSGNNGLIITEHADLKLAIPAVVFGAVGTAGQRCTTTRRLIVHEDIYSRVKNALTKAYNCIQIGNPLAEQNHMGPLISQEAVARYLEALAKVREQGGAVIYGGKVLSGKGYESGCYVTPALAAVEEQYPIVKAETFGPLLYLIKYSGPVAKAMAIHNEVDQGLSSSIFTRDIRQAEEFLSPQGSDCGLANVNLGTSGAEIGGAFGGEKETGGGREAGSDSWKAYMRRQTVTINYGTDLPLAQGIHFDLGP